MMPMESVEHVFIMKGEMKRERR